MQELAEFCYQMEAQENREKVRQDKQQPHLRQKMELPHAGGFQVDADQFIDQSESSMTSMVVFIKVDPFTVEKL